MRKDLLLLQPLGANFASLTGESSRRAAKGNVALRDGHAGGLLCSVPPVTAAEDPDDLEIDLDETDPADRVGDHRQQNNGVMSGPLSQVQVGHQARAKEHWANLRTLMMDSAFLIAVFALNSLVDTYVFQRLPAPNGPAGMAVVGLEILFAVGTIVPVLAMIYVDVRWAWRKARNG